MCRHNWHFHFPFCIYRNPHHYKKKRGNPIEFKNVITTRKSVRSFTGRQINEDALQNILYAANTAPVSQKDYQSIWLSVVQNQEILDKLQSLSGKNQHAFYGAPCILLVSTKPSVIPNISTLNVGGIIQNMLLAATNEQLGSIYLSYFLTQIDPLQEVNSLLHIPEKYTPVAAVGIGYFESLRETSSYEDIMKRIPTTMC